MSRKYYRYILYAVEIFILYIIEGTQHLLPQFYMAKPVLIISVAISIAAFEPPLASLFFGVFCGLVIDTGTGGILGLTSIILGVVCYYESYWNDKYIKNNVYLVLLYSAVSCVAVISLKFFVFYVVRGYDGAEDVYLSHYVPRILYSWMITPIIYALTMLVSRTFRKEKKKIKVRRRKRVAPSQRSSASRRRARLN